MRDEKSDHDWFREGGRGVNLSQPANQNKIKYNLLQNEFCLLINTSQCICSVATGEATYLVKYVYVLQCFQHNVITFWAATLDNINITSFSPVFWYVNSQKSEYQDCE